MTMWQSRPAPEAPGSRGAMRRRMFAAGAVTATVAAMVPLVLASTAQATLAPGTPLRTLAEAQGRYFGSDINANLISQSSVAQLQAQQFDMLTPDNVMKWDTVEPSNGSFNFSPGDQIVSYAKANNERVRCHNLVWQNQLPSWVSSLPSSQVQAAMEAHITGEATHFKGECYAWDVVNEPFNGDGSFVADPFFNAMGSGYIADALKTAHAADPNAKLYLNDYNIEGENAKSNAMFSLAQSLLAQGAPLNGIGFESHFILGQVPSDMEANMQRFANLGLDVAVTELDDRITLPATSANLAQQATEFATVVKDCLGVTRCVGVTQWAVGDADSWVPGTFSGQGAATMFDQSYNPKPAFTAVQQALGGSSSTPPPTTPPATTPPATTPPATTPPATTPPATGGCHVAYVTASQWAGGFVANVTINNTSTSAINGWTLKFTFPGDQHITNGWNGTASQSGEAVTITNVSYNGAIAAGGNTSLGFQGTWTNSDAAPTSFTVNGTACS
jgi:endo-1,4-beta-xylanase